MMHTPLVAETPRFSIFDDTRTSIASADLALLEDVNPTVGFRERNTLSRIVESSHTERRQISARKFKDAARQAECAEDEARSDEWLKKVAKGKPDKALE